MSDSDSDVRFWCQILMSDSEAGVIYSDVRFFYQIFTSVSVRFSSCSHISAYLSHNVGFLTILWLSDIFYGNIGWYYSFSPITTHLALSVVKKLFGSPGPAPYSKIFVFFNKLTTSTLSSWQFLSDLCNFFLNTLWWIILLKLENQLICISKMAGMA